MTPLDLALILAGHGYDTGGLQRDEPRGAVEDGGGGIATGSILGLIVLAAVTVALLVWLSPPSTKQRLRDLAPKAGILAIMLAPLLVWTATSGGGGDDASLFVDRGADRRGAPELLVSLADEGLNTLQTTNGARAVRVECLGRDGRVVVAARHRWPFVKERGFDYAHAHVRASEDQLQGADRCRLRGTKVRFEADVKGP